MLQTSEFSDGESTNDGSVYLETRSASDTVDVPDLVDTDAIPADLLDTGFQLVTASEFNALSAGELDAYLEEYAGHLLELWARLEHIQERSLNDWNRAFSITAEGHGSGRQFLQNYIRRVCVMPPTDSVVDPAASGLDTPATVPPHPLAITVFQDTSAEARRFRRVFVMLLDSFATRAGCFVQNGGANMECRSRHEVRLRQPQRVQAELLTVRHNIGDSTMTAVQVGQVLYGTETHWSSYWPHFFPEEYFAGGFIETFPLPFTHIFTDRKTRVHEFLSLCGLPTISALIVDQAIHNDVGAVLPYRHNPYYTDRHFPDDWQGAGDWSQRCLRHCIQRWCHQATLQILPHQVQLLGGHASQLRVAMEEQLVRPVWFRFMELFPNYSPGRRFAVRESLTAPKGSQLLREQYLREVWNLETDVARSIWEH